MNIYIKANRTWTPYILTERFSPVLGRENLQPKEEKLLQEEKLLPQNMYKFVFLIQYLFAFLIDVGVLL